MLFIVDQESAVWRSCGSYLRPADAGAFVKLPLPNGLAEAGVCYLDKSSLGGAGLACLPPSTRAGWNPPR